MPIPTELIVTVGGIAIAIASAAIYSAYTGNSASVDYDDDGNDEVTFGGESDDEETETDGGTVLTEETGEQIETSPSPYNNTPPQDGYINDEDTAETTDPPRSERTDFTTAEPPTSVQEIGENLASIRGIGPNRADTFREAGFDTATDLWFASDERILDVYGIGDRALTQIRSDIGSFDDDSE